VSLCSLGRRVAISNAEELVLAYALEDFDRRGQPSPTLHDVIGLLQDPTVELVAAGRYGTIEDLADQARDLVDTLQVMARGSLRGIFDAPTSQPLDLSAPAIAIDLSSIAGVDDDQGVAAAMLGVWAYAFNQVDAEIALPYAGLAPARNYLAVLDELWRALRGGPGLVDRADAMTRVNRQRRMGVVMVTHSLADLEALPTAADVAKAKGLIDRSSTVVIGAVPPSEVDELAKRIAGGLNTSERRLIASWAASADWSGDGEHPGIGRVLIKTGNRRGVPVDVRLTAPEIDLYENTYLA
jgi:hypothetical protein